MLLPTMQFCLYHYINMTFLENYYFLIVLSPVSVWKTLQNRIDEYSSMSKNNTWYFLFLCTQKTLFYNILIIF